MKEPRYLDDKIGLRRQKPRRLIFAVKPNSPLKALRIIDEPHTRINLNSHSLFSSSQVTKVCSQPRMATNNGSNRRNHKEQNNYRKKKKLQRRRRREKRNERRCSTELVAGKAETPFFFFPISCALSISFFLSRSSSPLEGRGFFVIIQRILNTEAELDLMRGKLSLGKIDADVKDLKSLLSSRMQLELRLPIFETRDWSRLNNVVMIDGNGGEGGNREKRGETGRKGEGGETYRRIK
ncbi:hypothetical protein M9H77_23144 [Catharanthus roseus]|uniref:Uncharacterized protein n=1 Tax=Catharanthus roseus TaxID=4058 RepID=A0ACC0ASW3_CATRO|nr:hypothetical protein M9H77_23144 [Catharanthus roseus]